MLRETNIISFCIILFVLLALNVFSYFYFDYLFNLLLFYNWVLLNALFDASGYGLIVYKNELWFLKKLVYTNREVDFNLKMFVIPYRIMQFLFFFLSLVIVLLFDFRVMLYCIIVWWFGFLDYLYYIILKVPIDEYLCWMENWSVHWVFKKVFGYECNKDSFVICAYISFVALTVFILLYSYSAYYRMV